MALDVSSIKVGIQRVCGETRRIAADVDRNCVKDGIHLLGTEKGHRVLANLLIGTSIFQLSHLLHSTCRPTSN